MEKPSVKPVLIKSFGNFTTTYSRKGITKQLQPYFEFEQIIGRCPFAFENIKGRNGVEKVRYDFKLSIRPIISAFSAVFIITSCILGSIKSQLAFNASANSALKMTNSSSAGASNSTSMDSSSLRVTTSKLGSTPTYVLAIFELTYVTAVILGYMFVWIKPRTLSNWLNEWNSIEDDLQSCTESSCNISLSKFWKYFGIPYIAIPSISFGLLVVSTGLNVKLILAYPFEFVVAMIYSFVATAVVQAEDVDVIVMFKIIELSFQQIKQSIQVLYFEKSTCGGDQANLTTLQIEDIQNWQKILIKIRLQTEQLGKLIALHELLTIGTLIFFASSAMFLSANLIGEQPDNITMPMVLYFTVLSFIRLFAKIFSAVQINEEEKRVAILLKKLELLENNQDLQYEMKGIYEMLIHCPTEVSLNNYATLNNSLILTISGQILSLFIVYQQLINAK